MNDSRRVARSAVLAVLLAGALAFPSHAADAAQSGVTVDEIVLQVLEHNRDLRIRRLRPERADTAIAEQRAVFDPTLSAEASVGRSTAIDGTIARRTTGTVGLRETLPTGTTVSLDGTTTRQREAEQTASGVSLGVTQALLRGRSLSANLASLDQARLDLSISRYEVRGFALALVERAERAYWELDLAERRLVIQRESLTLARRRLTETDERIRQGALAPTERASAVAAVAGQDAGVIDAEARLDRARLELLDLLDGSLTAAAPIPASDPAALGPADSLQPVDDHVQVGLNLSPDLHQAKLQRQRGDLDVLRTRDGVLPRLDLFVTLGRTGYARAFGPSLGGEDGTSRELSAGLRFEHVLGDRSGEARRTRSSLDLQELDLALANQRQLAERDIRQAHRDAQRADAQAIARATALAAAEAQYQAIAAGFQVARRTAYDVAQAERDLLQARLDAIEARITTRTARTTLYRADGSLLQRRGITAPGWDAGESE